LASGTASGGLFKAQNFDQGKFDLLVEKNELRVVKRRKLGFDYPTCRGQTLGYVLEGESSDVHQRVQL